MRCPRRRSRTVFSQGIFWVLLLTALAAMWILDVING